MPVTLLTIDCKKPLNTMKGLLMILIFSGSILFYSCEKKSENSNCDASATKGPLFTAAKTLIESRCSGGGCHINGGNADGYNFDADCSVVDEWSKIQSVCNSGSMPKAPQPSFSADEKAIINDWVSAGHRITD
jgi:uncharacterized membrane protein